MSNEQPETGNAAFSSEIYIPTATYRIQFHSDFPFSNAEKYVNYFQRLGISDIYTSPIWTARPGSRHCYDVIDHSDVNPELGGETAFKSLASALGERGLGVVVDVVPNHMGIMDPGNRQWWDVLENGPCSPFASFFDIDWRAYKEELHDRVELPTLGEQFGICL
jgi:(1->4)-alpha-D-glucan 1-alpha-D-glucosylmutase